MDAVAQLSSSIGWVQYDFFRCYSCATLKLGNLPRIDFNSHLPIWLHLGDQSVTEGDLVVVWWGRESSRNQKAEVQGMEESQRMWERCETGKVPGIQKWGQEMYCKNTGWSNEETSWDIRLQGM